MHMTPVSWYNVRDNKNILYVVNLDPSEFGKSILWVREWSTHIDYIWTFTYGRGMRTRWVCLGAASRHIRFHPLIWWPAQTACVWLSLGTHPNGFRIVVLCRMEDDHGEHTLVVIYSRSCILWVVEQISRSGTLCMTSNAQTTARGACFSYAMMV